MIRLIIAYDDEDYGLGDYFENSHLNIVTEVSTHATIDCLSIRGLNCNEDFIKSSIEGFDSKKFIFTALSHGNEEELVANEVFVSQRNISLFYNCLFYSTACSTGKSLGNFLINAGCLTFIGYLGEVEVILDYDEVFYNCENFGIKSFILFDETIETSYNKMLDYYNSEIDRLTLGSIDDLIAASSLVQNRDLLILLGDKNLKKNDFFWN